ncbi:hyalin-like [Patiria miniata]|uniref:HYR domain-containing protein n=1 Tax=Patiria miniata TaxID=46514 RepID=A0A913ZKT7_PATMI|nr:hyalin-like [Patiria miniata]
MAFYQVFLALFALFSAICLPGIAFKYNECPGPISVDTAPDSPTVAVTWKHPYLTGLGRVGSVSQTVSHDPGEQFPIGLTRVNYLAINSTDYRDLQVCTFVITVHDRIPPVFSTCPINVTSRLGPDQTETEVTWDIPQAVDNSKYVQLLSDHEPGTNFTAGTVVVTYTARDTTGNEAKCQFPVIVIPFVVTTTTMATTTMEATTAGKEPEKVTSKKAGENVSSGPGVVEATPIDWKVWVNRGLIIVSILCLLAFAIIAFFVFRKYHVIKRLKKTRIPDEETEIYPSSAGEEYDMWEDPPGSPAFQVNPSGASLSGRGEQRRLNKAEERPLLVAGGEHF